MILNKNTLNIPDYSGIYMLINIVNNKKWVGECESFRQRANSHENKLNINVGSKYLQKDWNEGHHFLFVVLESMPHATKQQRLEKEEFYTLFYKTNEIDFGYNILIGRKMDEEKRLEAVQRMKEIRNKRTFRKGEEVKSAKLKEEDVREILKLLKKGLKSREIAKMYNVQSPAIDKIKNNTSWKHIPR